MAGINLEVVGGVKPKRGYNRTWTAYADGKLIGIIEEYRETGEVIGLYITPGENKSTLCGPFAGTTTGEKTARAAGYMAAKLGL